MPNFQPGYYDPATGQFYPSNPQMQMGNTGFSPYGNQQPQPPQYQYNNPAPAPQSQQTPRQPSLPGRVVDDIKEVKPAEIPMDGTWCYFPLRNGTKVYVKLWDDTGELRTFSFIPEEPVIEGKKSEEQTKFDKILTRFDDLEAVILGKQGKKKEDK